MKKYLVLFIVLALLLTGCKPVEKVVSEENIHNQLCWNLGGSISKNGNCVLLPESMSCSVCKCAECAVCETVETVKAVEETEFDCKAAAEVLDAPTEMVRALCIPAGKGDVSEQLVSGTHVEIGSITFDSEDRVWFLQDFVTPPTANYSFEYIGAELKLFDAGFVVGSEKGWADDGSRVPFRICWNTEGDCQLPAGPDGNPIELFPTK